MIAARTVGLLVAGVLLAPAPVVAAERHPLTGWGPVKLGMSADEVRDSLAFNVSTDGDGSIVYKTKINWRPVSITFNFDNDHRRLSSFRINYEQKGITANECELVLHSFLSAFRVKYGMEDVVIEAGNGSREYRYILPNATIAYMPLGGDSQCAFLALYRIYHPESNVAPY